MRHLPTRPPLPPADIAHILESTQDLWNEARGQSFFITGGTGFFGMWLLESFAFANDRLALGMRATVLTRNVSAFATKAPHLTARQDFQFIEGDIRSFPFPPGDFPYVIHAATEASAKLIEESPDEMLDTIVAGTRHALKFAAKSRCRKFLLTSSGAVYGAQPRELTHVPEDFTGAPDPLVPGSAYGMGKRVAEHMAAVHAKKTGCEIKVARCFAFVGPHLPLDTHFAIGNFIRDAMAGRPIQIGGDGSPHRSYLYAADLTIWLWTILFRGQSCRAYNVGSSDSLSIASVASVVDRLIGGHGVQIAKQSVPGAAPSLYVPDVRRAAAELNLVPTISLDDAVARTRAWHQLPPH